MRRIPPGLALPCLLACAACAGPRGEPPADPSRLEVVRLEPVEVRGYTRTDLIDEFERSRSLLLGERYGEAALAFDKLAKLALDAELAAASLYHAASAYESAGDNEPAILRYTELAEKHGDKADARLGMVRLTRLLGYLERWREVEAAADALLGRADLTLLDQIEGEGYRAIALASEGRVDDAERSIGRALEVIDRNHLGQAGAPPVQLAAVFFALGEVRRLRSEQVKLVPVTAQFSDVLERRCKELLDAQSAYTDAMRAKDAHWSAMSGYRVGQLYQQLHREAMAIPPPDNAQSERDRQLFEGAMRLRYHKLLEKGLAMMESVLRLGDRTGESSYWVTRARQAKADLEQSMADETAALARMPFTAEQMRLALEKLKARAKAQQGASTPVPSPKAAGTGSPTPPPPPDGP
ncbi:MAG: hypothetical protein HY908_27680 [Myxococcales bacterium]|nr:hypothetical protein [Myxococcales bacterium]